jgi:hypothetical protein
MLFNRPNPAERDHELLSAYLDGRLDARERIRLEARLAAEPALRAELDELRRTVAAIRALPRVRAPRRFTLDPKLARRPQPSPLGRLYPALQLATVVSALVFVFLLAGRAALPQAGVLAPAAAPAQPAAGATSAPSEAPEVLSQAAGTPEGTPLPGDALPEGSVLATTPGAEPTVGVTSRTGPGAPETSGPDATVTPTVPAIMMAETPPAPAPAATPAADARDTTAGDETPPAPVDLGLWLTGAVGLLALVFAVMTWVARRAG